MADLTQDIVPHITGVFDTSGTGPEVKEHEQIQTLLDYTLSNIKPRTDVIENPPEDAVTEESVHEQDAPVDPQDDTVAGTPLNDGLKDPADTLEAEHVNVDENTEVKEEENN